MGSRAHTHCMPRESETSSTVREVRLLRCHNSSFPAKTPEHQRLSVNDHTKDTLIQSLEDVARDVVKGGFETTGIDKLQTIMTQAKEKVRTYICAPSSLSGTSPSSTPVPLTAILPRPKCWYQGMRLTMCRRRYRLLKTCNLAIDGRRKRSRARSTLRAPFMFSLFFTLNTEPGTSRGVCMRNRREQIRW